MHLNQTQPAPREYHTQYYVLEVHRLVELNHNIMVRHVERMEIDSPSDSSLSLKMECHSQWNITQNGMSLKI